MDTLTYGYDDYAEMLSNCEQDWSLERLCRAVSLEKSQFYSYYHSFFSSTPKNDLLQVRLEKAHFAAKDYGSFRLPAGEYTALRIELGKAAGHNWFCVLYPELCIGSSEARYDTPEENTLVFGRFEVRSALWDGLCRLKSWATGKD